jgi:hypothetical protein
MHLCSHVWLLRLCARDKNAYSEVADSCHRCGIDYHLTDDDQGLVRGGVPVQPAHWNVAASRCTSRGDVEALLTLMQRVGAAADVDLFRRLQQIGTTAVSAPA